MAKKRLAELGAYDPKTRSVPVVASTPNPTDGVGPDGEPVKECLLSWDLTTRFASNPIILFNHNSFALPIGIARDIEQTKDGLMMRIFFASEKANPLAEQVANCVEEGILRAVSVGFEPGPGTERFAEDGTKVIDRVDNVLLEVSVVPIGADDEAGTVDINPMAAKTRSDASPVDEALDALKKAIADLPKQEPIPEPDEHDETTKKRISDAARTLSKHRARLAAKRIEEAAKGNLESRSDAMEHRDVARLDADLSKFPDTQVGGKVIPARLTRIGVLKYLQPDGSYRRELRLPEEVFKGDSMKSLEHAPVIDIKHHRSMVSPETYKEAKLGHVSSVRREGNYLVGDVRVDDADALAAIASDERKDVSCGYTCRLDWTKGEYEGEPYDCIQRDVTYNHLALCPPNRGRAGTDVGLRLDANETFNGGVAMVDVDQQETSMPTNEKPVVKIRLDGKEVIEHSPEHFAILSGQLERATASATDLTTKLDAVTKRADAAEGERDGLKSEIEKVRADAKADADAKAEKAKEKEKAEKGFVRARRKLERATIRYFGGPDDEEDEDEEEDEKSKKSKGKEMKSDADEIDAMESRLDSMDDRELMIFCIKKVEPKFDGKDAEGNDRSLDYITARFDAAVESRKAQKTISGVVGGLDGFRRLDASENFDASDADRKTAETRKKRDEAMANAWKTVPANFSK